MLICSCLTVRAQLDDKKTIFSDHYLGAAAGFSTGYGLSYRYWPGKFGGQFTFAPYCDPFEIQLSTGLSLLYKVKSYGKVNLFLYQGNHIYYYGRHWELWKGKLTVEEGYGRQFHGLGFGLEFVILKRLSLNLMTGYSMSKWFGDNEWLLNMTGETGIYFRL